MNQEFIKKNKYKTQKDQTKNKVRERSRVKGPSPGVMHHIELTKWKQNK